MQPMHMVDGMERQNILTAGLPRLVVASAYTRDVGRAVVRIDYDMMDSIGASAGDVVEVTGKWRAAAKCLPLYPSDEWAGIIKVDEIGRRNLGVSTGDTINIRKTVAAAAKTVAVVPLGETPPEVDEKSLADSLLGMPLLVGMDVLAAHDGGRFAFRVDGAEPAVGVLLVTPTTSFTIMDGA